MIYNIQILRAFAALAVVFYHAQLTYFGQHTQFQGVDIFFVISGFIMAKVSQTEGNEFLWKRLIRIVPAYWFVTIISFYLFSIGAVSIADTAAQIKAAYITDPSIIANWLTTLNWSEWGRLLIKSLLFIPDTVDGKVVFPFIAVGWSLNVEMLFYVLFSCALLISRKHSSLLVCSSLIIIFLAGVILKGWSPILDFYSKPFLFYFIAGVALFFVDRRINILKLRKAPVIIASILATINLVAFGVSTDYSTQLYGPLAAVMFYTAPVALVFTWLLLGRVGLDIKSRPMVYMGAASYSLYLVHMPVIIMLQQLSVATGWVQGGWPIVLLTVTISISLAALLHKWVEMPFSRVLRGQKITAEKPAIIQVNHH